MLAELARIDHARKPRDVARQRPRFHRGARDFAERRLHPCGAQLQQVELEVLERELEGLALGM